jgi:hypothetical protein
MDFFHALREINGEKCKDYFWGGIMNIHNNIFIHDAQK